MRSRRPVGVAALIGAILVASCAKAPQGKHLSLSSVDPLQAAFNADSGKVRAIFLASPT